MRLFIIRHGQSTNNKLDGELDFRSYLSQRTPDPALTELGERQALAVANHLAAGQTAEHFTGYHNGAGYGITRIYCSAMLRAMQTALPIQKALKIDPEVNLHIYEQGGLFLGDPRNQTSCRGFPGMSRSEMTERFPNYTLPPEITADGWYSGSYEPQSSCNARAEKTTQWLGEMAAQFAKEGTDEGVALVMHADFIDKLIKAIIGHGSGEHFRYTHQNTSITRIDFAANGTRRLLYVNRTEHFTSDLFY